MRRHLLNFLTAVSLLLFAAACVLWIYSVASRRPARPALSVQARQALYQVSAEPYRGGIGWIISPSFGRARWRLSGRVYSAVPDNWASTRYSVLGFTVAWHSRADADRANARSHSLSWPFVAGLLPYWFIALVTGILPARLFWLRQRRDRSLRLGHCRQCGYDLRATPDRCPECGTPVLQPADRPAAPHSINQ